MTESGITNISKSYDYHCSNNYMGNNLPIRQGYKQQRRVSMIQPVKCAACGQVHTDIWCPVCKCVLSVKV